MTDPKPKPHLSISQLEMLSKCGEQYRRRYIEEEIIPPAVAMLVGRSVDKSVDENLIHKIQTDELLSPGARRNYRKGPGLERVEFQRDPVLR